MGAPGARGVRVSRLWFGGAGLYGVSGALLWRSCALCAFSGGPLVSASRGRGVFFFSRAAMRVPGLSGRLRAGEVGGRARGIPRFTSVIREAGSWEARDFFFAFCWDFACGIFFFTGAFGV